MNLVQPAAAQAGSYRPPPQPHFDQLPLCDQAVLPSRKLSNLAIIIARPQKSTLGVPFCGLGGRFGWRWWHWSLDKD
jgi:hypothetical protein